MAGRSAGIHTLRDLGIAHPPIFLEQAKNLDVDPVEIVGGGRFFHFGAQSARDMRKRDLQMRDYRRIVAKVESTFRRGFARFFAVVIMGKRTAMLAKFERYKLTFGPTPIEKLSRLTAHLGGDVEIFAKREDCNSGLAFGGNKLRKLEYIIPDAIASNADTLVSIGGVQSNHTRMVAAVAAKIGMKCVLIQESWVPHEDAVYDRVGNI